MPDPRCPPGQLALAAELVEPARGIASGARPYPDGVIDRLAGLEDEYVAVEASLADPEMVTISRACAT